MCYISLHYYYYYYITGENAHFDGTFNRVHGFVSFTLWMFHPTLRKVLRLANMEQCTENMKDITIFFMLFNEVLAKVSGKEGYKFNPRAFICDEGGANFTGLKEVYGKDFVKNHVFGCQWHFLSDAEKKARNIPDQKMREKFLDICKKLTTATTVSKYNILKSQLDEMAKIYPTLQPWIKWWDARRSHIFAPF